MQHVNFNNTDDFDMTNNGSSQYHFIIDPIIDVMEFIIICMGLPLTVVAICAVYCLVQTDHPAPVYVINLFLSDLIQLCCMAAWKAGEDHDIIKHSYTFAVLASVGFMVFISLERYLVIAHPLWYRFRRNIKTSLVVCGAVWIAASAVVLSVRFIDNQQVEDIICGVYILLPLPLLIFFLTGTIRALSAARCVPVEEKQRIVAILVVVLLIYTLLFLPNIIWSLVEELGYYPVFTSLASICLLLSPLADLTMYFCIRKSAMDELLKSLCRCKMPGNQEMSSTAVVSMSAPSTETV